MRAACQATLQNSRENESYFQDFFIHVFVKNGGILAHLVSQYEITKRVNLRLQNFNKKLLVKEIDDFCDSRITLFSLLWVHFLGTFSPPCIINR
jgi:hypothetical protein